MSMIRLVSMSNNLRVTGVLSTCLLVLIADKASTLVIFSKWSEDGFASNTILHGVANP